MNENTDTNPNGPEEPRPSTTSDSTFPDRALAGPGAANDAVGTAAPSDAVGPAAPARPGASVGPSAPVGENAAAVPSRAAGSSSPATAPTPGAGSSPETTPVAAGDGAPASSGPAVPSTGGASASGPAAASHGAPATVPAGSTGHDATGHSAASHGGAHPTQAYPTDAFGRPAPNAEGVSAIGHPAPSNGYGSAYGSGTQFPTQQYGSTPPQEPGKRRGSAALVAALAVGALIGGASGAGVTALVAANQTPTAEVSNAEGPSNVVVNDSENVNQITAVAAKSAPSVVTLSVTSNDGAGTGSGVILSEDGYVITNTHVVTLDGASSDPFIQVQDNEGNLYSAEIVGTDPVSDLAVIKMADASGLQAIEWADSSELNVGDTTIAIGAPLGLAGTVTNGIVSALNRSITVASSAAPDTEEQTPPDENDGQRPFDFWNFDIPGEGDEPTQPQRGTSTISLSVIQTDAAINPGNSGGALLNSQGELIGVNVAIANAGSSSGAAGSIGVGFAIPSNLAKRVSEEIIETGRATHGLLGATVSNAASEESSTTVGAVIAELSPGGAAEEAGLQEGDIITNFNDVPITDANDLTAQVRALPAGGEADVTFIRDGESITVSVTVGELTS